MKISGYVAGSIYKRFNGTTMSQSNRAIVQNNASAGYSYGNSVFSTNLAKTQGITELVAKQYAARVTEEAKAKLSGASDIASIIKSLSSGS